MRADPTWRLLYPLMAVLASCAAQEGGPEPVPYAAPASCAEREFFQSGNLSCLPCTGSQLPAQDGVSCGCGPGFIRAIGSAGSAPSCQPCAEGEVTSSDGLFCLRCSFPLAYNSATASCDPCDPTEVYVDLLPQSQLEAGNRSCLPCPQGTWPDGSGQRCVECGIPDCLSCSSVFISGGVCFSSVAPLPQAPADAFPYYREHFSAASALCGLGNQTACQLLVNLCALRQYAPSDPACLQARAHSGDLLPEPEWPVGGADEVLERAEFVTRLVTRGGAESVSSLPLVVTTFDLGGALVGVEELTNQIQLCQELPSRASAAWSVGLLYKIECLVSVAGLASTAQSPMFHDLYFHDRNTDASVDRLYPIPILPTVYRDAAGAEPNQGSNPSSWQFVRRFFLAESVTNSPQYVHNMQLRVMLRSDGLIFTPYLRVVHEPWTPSSVDHLPASFSVEYRQDNTGFDVGLAVSAACLAALAVVLAGFRVNGFLRRAGSLCCELHTFVFAMAEFCHIVSGLILLLLSAASLFWLVFFKAQTTYFLALPLAGGQQLSFSLLLALALLFRATHTVYLIWHQSSIEVFFIDWERPRGVILTTNQIADGLAPPTASTTPVSIWRTYFVANEWNEIQSLRRTSPTLRLVIVLLFLEVIGLQHLAESAPSSHVSSSPSRYSPPHSSILRFSLTSLAFFLTAATMWLYVFLIHERFIEHKIRQFTDLCSVSNVSVFMMSRRRYGHYIHGRSVHGHADTDMREMNSNLRKEQDDMCGRRGLEADSDLQTFEMALSGRFRGHFDRIVAPLLAERAEAGGAFGRRPEGHAGTSAGPSAAALQAYDNMNHFLSAFIERSLTEVDFVVKDKLLAEKVLGMELYDPVDRSLFYRDPSASFDSLLFYGNEWRLLCLDLLVFATVDLAAHNFVLAAIVTFIVGWLLAFIRDILGRRNLGRKTLVDDRFLI